MFATSALRVSLGAGLTTIVAIALALAILLGSFKANERADKRMSKDSKRWLRLIVNGKAAGDPLLRPAVKEIRDAGHQLDVRVTWEAGDAARMAGEAITEGVDVVEVDS